MCAVHDLSCCADGQCGIPSISSATSSTSSSGNTTATSSGGTTSSSSTTSTTTAAADSPTLTLLSRDEVQGTVVLPRGMTYAACAEGQPALAAAPCDPGVYATNRLGANISDQVRRPLTLVNANSLCVLQQDV